MRNVSLLVLSAITLFADDDKKRVFITQSDSWELSGGYGAGASGGTVGGTGRISGGARPQTVEIMKTFRERCGGLTITLDRTRADYIVLLDREGGKDIIAKDNKVAVFKRDGDMLHSGSTRSLGNAVSDACNAIRKHGGR